MLCNKQLYTHTSAWATKGWLYRNEVYWQWSKSIGILYVLLQTLYDETKIRQHDQQNLNYQLLYYDYC